MKKLLAKLDTVLQTNFAKYTDHYFPSTLEKEARIRRRSLYSEFLKSGDVYFDIGANYGNRITPLIGEGIRIIALEPQPLCISFLKKVFKSNITIVPMGVGSEEGQKLELHIANTNTISSFSDDFIKKVKNSGRFGKNNWNKTIQVEMVTLDTLIQKYGNPNFIKIDVEGFELEVLKGLTTPVNFISFEYTVPEQNKEMKQCLDQLNKIYESKIQCNYSIGESMVLEMEKWISINEMITLINSKTFTDTQFGDIYVKKVN